MANTAKNTITQNRIKSPRLWLILAAAAALFTDIFVTVLLAIGGYDFTYMFCTVFMLALDALLLVGAFLSNYRFKYSRLQWIIYAALTTVFTLVNTLVCLFSAGGTFVTYFAGISWLVVHVAAIIATIVGALRAGKFGKKGVGAAVCVAVFIALVCVYSVMAAGGGVFGQGSGETVRALVYSESEYGYTVSGVLNGKGNVIVIPESFNGKKVEAVDMSVFMTEGLTKAEVRCSSDVEFVNFEPYNEVPESLAIEVPRENIDAFREKFYAMSSEWDNFASALILRGFANAMVPADLGEDEVYVAFRYDSSALSRSEDEIIPVWIGKKGTTFSFDYCMSDVSFVKYSDHYDDGDLFWNMANNGGYILSSLKDGNGNDIDGSRINESTEVSVSFEKIYSLYIEEDNDTKYESPDSYRYASVNGSYLNCRYVTADTAESVISDIPEREGFTLSWQYSLKEGSAKNPLTDVESVISTASSVLYVYPVWKLNAPSQLTASSDAAGNTVIYGENISLSASAKAPVNGYDVTYVWEKNGETVSGASGYDIINIYPEHAGVYKVTATASSATETSLTSTATTQITVVMQKRTLNVGWTLPEGDDLIYSASEKTVGYEFDSDQVINDDIITLGNSFSGQQFRNAGKYSLTVFLEGDCADKYTIPASDAAKSFEILPKETEVSWGALESVYDGEYHTPTATAPGIGGELVPVTVNGSIRNAGNMTMTAVTSDGNYKLTNASAQYTVTRKAIGAVWSNETLVYNASSQVRRISALTGCVEGEESDTLNQVIYTGYQTNAGSGYTSFATLPEGSNYSLDVSQAFEIDKKKATVTVKDLTEKYYDGKSLSTFSYNTDGFIQSFDKVVGYEFTGNAVGAVNAGEYSYTISLLEDGYELSGNYDITVNATGRLVINPREISLTWNKNKFTYNGGEQKPEITDIGNCVAAEKATLLSEYNAMVTPQINVGSDYQATVTLEDGGNYTFVSGALTGTYKFTIEKKKATVTVNGVTETYNGEAHNTFGVTSTGLVDSEENVYTVSYTVKNSSQQEGAAVNAGEYTVVANLTPGSKYNNYDITVNAGTLVIRQKEISFNWGVKDFVYSGSQQKVVLESVTGCVEKDESGLIDGINSQITAATNAGTYTFEVTLPANGNYVLAGNVYSASVSFKISKAELTAVWSNTEFTYDGEKHVPTVTVQGAVNDETDAVVSGLVITGGQTSAGTYKARATLPASSNYVFASGNNYSETSFTIEKKELTVSVNSVTTTYSGANYNNFSVSVNGLVAKDTQADVFTVRYSVRKPGSASALTDYSDVGTYVVSAVITPGSKYNNYKITATEGELKVEQKQLSVTALSAVNKTYDGTVNVEVRGSFVGLVTGDNVQLSLTGTTTDKNVGDGKTVNVVASVSGADSGNYKLTQPSSTTVNVNKKELTVGNVTATDKTYDGNANIVVTGTLDGVVQGDDVNLTISGTASDKNAGTNKTVTVNASISGGDSQNYSLTQPGNTTVTISKATLTITGVTAVNREEDGSVNVELEGGTLSGMIYGDNVTFDLGTGTVESPEAGQNKKVTTNIILGGTDGGNYTLTQPTYVTVTIKASEETDAQE